MNSTPDQIKIFLSMLSVQSPTLIVCLVACIMILARGKRLSHGALWALLGFGLVMVMCFAVPIMQTIIQSWVFQSGQRAERLWALSVSSTIWSVLHAVAYAFLLAAVFAGRSNPTPPGSVPEPPGKG